MINADNRHTAALMRVAQLLIASSLFPTTANANAPAHDILHYLCVRFFFIIGVLRFLTCVFNDLYEMECMYIHCMAISTV